MRIKIVPPDFITELLTDVVLAPIPNKSWKYTLADRLEAERRIRYGVSKYVSYLLLELFDILNASTMVSLEGSHLFTQRYIDRKVKGWEFIHYDDAGFSDFIREFNSRLDDDYREDVRDRGMKASSLLRIVTNEYMERMERALMAFNDKSDEISDYIYSVGDALLANDIVAVDSRMMVEEILFGASTPGKAVEIHGYTYDSYSKICEDVNYLEKERRGHSFAEISEDWQMRIRQFSGETGTWFIVEDDSKYYYEYNELPIRPKFTNYSFYAVLE